MRGINVTRTIYKHGADQSSRSGGRTSEARVRATGSWVRLQVQQPAFASRWFTSEPMIYARRTTPAPPRLSLSISDLVFFHRSQGIVKRERDREREREGDGDGDGDGDQDRDREPERRESNKWFANTCRIYMGKCMLEPLARPRQKKRPCDRHVSVDYIIRYNVLQYSVIC